MSQKLLPQMGVFSPDMNSSHILILTELFNVGILGMVPLMCLSTIVIIKQVKTIKGYKNINNNINELLFATLISMLAYRMTGDLIAIPYLWFILGLSSGVCELYWGLSSASGK